MTNKELEKRTEEWVTKGKRPEEITYGMLCDGFQSISGIPDDFHSAEDPEDRGRLWSERQKEKEWEKRHSDTSLYDGNSGFYPDD